MTESKPERPDVMFAKYVRDRIEQSLRGPDPEPSYMERLKKAVEEKAKKRRRSAPRR